MMCSISKCLSESHPAMNFPCQNPTLPCTFPIRIPSCHELSVRIPPCHEHSLSESHPAVNFPCQNPTQPLTFPVRIPPCHELSLSESHPAINFHCQNSFPKDIHFLHFFMSERTAVVSLLYNQIDLCQNPVGNLGGLSEFILTGA